VPVLQLDGRHRDGTGMMRDHHRDEIAIRIARHRCVHHRRIHVRHRRHRGCVERRHGGIGQARRSDRDCSKCGRSNCDQTKTSEHGKSSGGANARARAADHFSATSDPCAWYVRLLE